MEQQNGGYPQVPPPQVTTAPPPPDQSQAAAQLEGLEKTVKSGGSWFYWIAGMSLINTIALLAGSHWNFVIGLGATQIVDGITKHVGSMAMLIGLPISLFISAIYAMFGYFACQRARWAFIVGMILYGLDTLIFVAFFDILPLAFHAWALFGLSRGLKADTLASQLEAKMQQGAV
jgi:hypothetical protein